MEDLKKKEALREVLKNVRNAHELIIEYQKRILHIIEYIKCELTKSSGKNCSYNLFHFPNRTNNNVIYEDLSEFFFGSKKTEDDKKDVFRILLATGNSEKKQSELIFILDRNGFLGDIKVQENYFYNIVDKNEKVLEELKENGCVIQRRNIEDFYNEEAVRKEWKEISKNFPSCWINNYKGAGKEG